MVGCDVVISVCPPGEATAVARTVRGFDGLYLDANAVSPATAAEVSRIVTRSGATYVDGGIVGPPPVTAGDTRLYLSGTRATDVADLFQGTIVDARVLPSGDFAASSVKMAYASWTKISGALLLATRATAEHLGVGEVLDEEWAQSQPLLAARLAAARRSAESKGWRWVAEMREIAATFEDAGEPSGFGEAAAQVFEAHPRPE